MKPIYHRLDVDFWSSPKVVAAGLEAAVLYQRVLGLNTKKGRDGRLTPQESAPRFLRTLLVGVFPKLTERGVATAIEAAVRERLLLRADDGDLEIVGWDESWTPRMPMTGAERSQRHRDGKRDAYVGTANATPGDGEVTDRNTRRAEESRGEQRCR